MNSTDSRLAAASFLGWLLFLAFLGIGLGGQRHWYHPLSFQVNRWLYSFSWHLQSLPQPACFFLEVLGAAWYWVSLVCRLSMSERRLPPRAWSRATTPRHKLINTTSLRVRVTITLSSILPLVCKAESIWPSYVWRIFSSPVVIPPA